jgi:hypothetical protein
MILDHVEPARSRRQPGDPVHPNHREGSGNGWRRPRGPPCSAFVRWHTARAHVLRDLKVLTDPEGKATNQRPRLGPPEVSAEWAVVALAEHLLPEPTAGGDTEAVCRALPAAV